MDMVDQRGRRTGTTGCAETCGDLRDVRGVQELVRRRSSGQPRTFLGRGAA